MLTPSNRPFLHGILLRATAGTLSALPAENELRKESSNLDNQIECLKKVTEEVNKACESLDTNMASARSYGVTVGKAISLALDRVDSFDTKQDGIKAFKFTSVLDNQSLKQIQTEQESLKEEYKKYLNEHKKMLNQLLEFEKSILSNHRKELTELTKQHSLWLSDKNFYITVAVIVFLLALFYLFGYLKARAVFT